MSRTWMDQRAEQALSDAVGRIEGNSAAEVAVAIRRSARSWPHVPLIVGFAVTWGALAFMLFSDPVFPLIAFIIDPLLFGVLAGALATLHPLPLRLLTSNAARHDAALRAARATFVDRGVHRTRARTGLLVYCALSEGKAIVVADTGIERAVPESTLSAWESRIRDAMAKGGVATAEAIATMAATLATALPRAADDVNELADVIEHDIDRRPRT